MFLKSSVVDTVLSPCSDEAPVGTDLRANRSAFRPLRNQYNVARTSFRQLMQEPDALEREQLVKTNQLNWQSLSEQLVDILDKQSKDLELISWLCECQLFGPQPWQGLNAALDILVQMLDSYWPDCHPGSVPSQSALASSSEEPEAVTGEDAAPDVERRVGILRNLFGEGGDTGLLVLPVRMAPLVSSITLGDMLAAEHKGESEQLKTQLLAELSKDSQGHEAQELRDIAGSLYAIRQLMVSLDGRLQELCEGGWPPGSLGPFQGLIDTLIRWLSFICAEQVPEWPEDTPEPATDLETTLESTSPDASPAEQAVETANEKSQLPSGSTPPSEIMAGASVLGVLESQGLQSQGSTLNRQQAYFQLQELAEFFRKTEPHSPVVCLLDRAVSWGRLSVSELMKELLTGHDRALARMDDLTGLLSKPASPFSKPPVSSSISSSDMASLSSASSYKGASNPASAPTDTSLADGPPAGPVSDPSEPSPAHVPDMAEEVDTNETNNESDDRGTAVAVDDSAVSGDPGFSNQQLM